MFNLEDTLEAIENGDINYEELVSLCSSLPHDIVVILLDHFQENRVSS